MIISQTSCEHLPSLGFLHTFKPGLFLLAGSSAWATHAVFFVSYTCPFSPGG